MPETDELEQLVDTLATILLVLAADLQPELDVLAR